MQAGSVISSPPHAGERGDLRIGGFTAFTTTDYPGALAAVVFCQGCPWRCSYCHNPHLLPTDGPETHAWADILAFLETRRGLLDAVVFSGGEPTLQRGLGEAMQAVKTLGFKVGLHSAGMYPERLAAALPWVDWIGLDVKALPEDYARITGVPDSGRKAWESLRHVLHAAVPYQLRCTWDRTLLSEADVTALHATLGDLGAVSLSVQTCRPPSTKPTP